MSQATSKYEKLILGYCRGVRRTMTINKCFHNKDETQKVLELWVDHGLGIFVNEEKLLFMPMNFKE